MHRGSETWEKFVEGFKVVPSAGPIFDKELIAPEKQVTISRSQKDNAIVPTTRHTKYKPI